MPQIWPLITTRIYYLTISVGQESVHGPCLFAAFNIATEKRHVKVLLIIQDISENKQDLKNLKNRYINLRSFNFSLRTKRSSL